MIVYRIAQSALRAPDLSGTGAFKNGGRWNNKGTYMLYTSMNSSLAYLENLVHFDEYNRPPNLYIATIEIKNNAPVYELPDAQYPPAWQAQYNLKNKTMGDLWMRQNKYMAFKVRSAINPAEYNFLLNPLYPGYHDKVIVNLIEPIGIDTRLIR